MISLTNLSFCKLYFYRKTLIAVLLIQQYLSGKNDEDTEDTGDDAENEQRQIVFLVPSVALALQQQQVLQPNLPTRTVELACANNIDRERLSKSRVFVATHGAYLDLLRHDKELFSLEKVSLLILDECHNCTGNSPYAELMREFYHKIPPNQQDNKRPRVLGLTASPLINAKINHSTEQLASQLATLEANMDAKIASFDCLLDEMEDDNARVWLQQDVEETVIDFNNDDDIQNSIPRSGAPTFLNLSPVSHLHKTRQREFKQLEKLGSDLGALALGLYCWSLLRELSRNTYENETVDQFQSAMNYLRSIVDYCEEYCREDTCHGGRSSKLRVLENLLEKELQVGDAVGVVFVQRRITALALKQYFAFTHGNYAKETDRHQNSDIREHAEGLNVCSHRPLDGQFDDADEDEMAMSVESQVPDQFADADSENGPFSSDASKRRTESNHVDCRQEVSFQEPSPYPSAIRCDSLVRNPSKLFKSLSGSKRKDGPDLDNDREQWLHDSQNIRKVLDGLREGDINVLVATSMVEEGVDVQSCSFVIVLDSLTSIKSYVQMKGRTRQKRAKFYVFHDRGQLSSNLDLVDAKTLEKRVRQVVATESHRKGGISPVMESVFHAPQEPVTLSLVEHQALLNRKYEGKHGTAYLSSAKSILYRYALRQPLDSATRASQKSLQAYLPFYDELNTQLMLPAYAGASTKLRVITLPEQYHGHTKKDKQNMLALIACIRLHQHGLLTDRILPLERHDIRLKINSMTQTDPQINKFSPQPPPVIRQMISINVHEIIIVNSRIDQARRILNNNETRLAVVAFEDLAPIPPFEDWHQDFGHITITLTAARKSECSREQVGILFDFFTLIINSRWKRRTLPLFFGHEGLRESTIPLYAVGCIHTNRNLDWNLMQTLLAESKRSKDERINAVSTASSVDQLAKPRLWCPLYDEMAVYISYGPSDKKCSSNIPSSDGGDAIKTYQDFIRARKSFEVPPESQMYYAQRCWHLKSRRSTEVDAEQFRRKEPQCCKYSSGPNMCDFLKTVLLPKHACMELPFAHAGVMLECNELPQFLYHLERILTARTFVKYCQEQLPCLGSVVSNLPESSVLPVLTSQSCSGEVSYERLEFLGDAVLNLICTDVSLRSKKLLTWVCNLREGELDALRSELCCNKRLTSACRKLGIDQFLLTSALSRGKWTPSALKLFVSDGKNNVTEAMAPNSVPNEKRFADMIEALLGLVYLHGGYSVAIQVAEELTITAIQSDIAWDIDVTDHIGTSSRPANRDLLQLVENFTGYTPYKRSSTFEQAVTHPTLLDPEQASYERLEWIGDAVLALSVRKWIFHKFPSSPVGQMECIEQSVVCNETLAFLSWRSGVHKYLRHQDQTMIGRIELYEWTLKHGRGLWGTDPPKAIADICESLIGAVYLDGGFEAGQDAALHVVTPVLKIFPEDDSASDEFFGSMLYHPKRKLREIGGSMISFSTRLEDATCSKNSSIEDASAVLVGTRKARQDGHLALVSVSLLGFELVSSIDFSGSSAANRACSLILACLKRNEELARRFVAARNKQIDSVSL